MIPALYNNILRLYIQKKINAIKRTPSQRLEVLVAPPVGLEPTTTALAVPKIAIINNIDIK